MLMRPASSNPWTKNLVTPTLVATLCSAFADIGGASSSLTNAGYATLPGGTGVTSVLGRTFDGSLLVATTLFDSKEVQVQKIAPNGTQTEVGSVPTSGNGQAIAFAGGHLLVANASTNTLAAYAVRKNQGDSVTLLLSDEIATGGENPTSLVVRRKLPTGTGGSERGEDAARFFGANNSGHVAKVANPGSNTIEVFEFVDDTLFFTRRVEADQIDQMTEGNTDPPPLGAGQGFATGGRNGRRRASAGAGGTQSVLGVAFSGTNEIGVLQDDDAGTLPLLQPPVSVGARPRRVRFAPEGDFLYVAVAKRTVQQPNVQDEIRAYRVAPDGKLTLENTISAGLFLTDIQVFPRGLAAATVSSNIRNEIRVYRREGANLTLDRSLETSPAGQTPSFQQLSIARRCGAVESTRIIVTEYQASRLGSLVYTPDLPADTPCAMLNQGRFEVRVDWSVPAENRSGVATATAITGDTGYFWFFDPANVELVVKVLDGRAINGNFWVYYGALTDVRYTITITDTETGEVRTYVNPSGNQASAADIDAFGGSSSTSTSVDLATNLPLDAPAAGSFSGWLPSRDQGEAAASAPSSLQEAQEEAVDSALTSGATCIATTKALCLAESRFEVRVDWSVPGQSSGTGNVVSLTADTGYFWFFDAANVELIVKVLDARVINGKFWVFYGALSDVEYTITVTDTETGAVKTYSNPAGTLGSGSDTSAF